MRLTPTDPDIQTLYGRIVNRKIDLQPDFQRGEVWSVEKKRALIDTILRGWHVPPIHIIVVEDTGAQEVLDGQQRLVAIRDFMAGEFSVDGFCEPLNKELMALDGCFYKELPLKHKNNFDNYSIRQFLITDFEPGEPGELFHRLNQHVRLTPAEKRNAFYGPVRVQIKKLVANMERVGLDKNTLGFSNSRMAYDDVLSKFLVYLERGSLREKVTESDITELFRRQHGFDSSVFEAGDAALSIFAVAVKQCLGRIKFNKATFLSWLLFISRLKIGISSYDILSNFLSGFENIRASIRQNKELGYYACTNQIEEILLVHNNYLLNLFNDRASSRVADVSSVIARDFVLHHCFLRVLKEIDSLDVSDIDFPLALSRVERGFIVASLGEGGSEYIDSEFTLEKLFDFWGDFK